MKGYTAEHNSWEPAHFLKHAKKLIERFHKEHPKAIRVIAQYVKADPNAVEPKRSSKEAVGFDLYSVVNLEIEPESRKLVETGIKVKCPASSYLRIAPRSGMALKGIDVAAGVVDPDYTGTIKVLLVNTTKELFKVSIGDRIAQGIFELAVTPSLEKVEGLEGTSRGTQGFGSTGI